MLKKYVSSCQEKCWKTNVQIVEKKLGKIKILRKNVQVNEKNVIVEKKGKKVIKLGK